MVGIRLDEVFFFEPGGGTPPCWTKHLATMAVVKVSGGHQGPFSEHAVGGCGELGGWAPNHASINKLLPSAHVGRIFSEDVQELVLEGFWGYVTPQSQSVYVFYNERPMFRPDGLRIPS